MYYCRHMTVIIVIILQPFDEMSLLWTSHGCTNCSKPLDACTIGCILVLHRARIRLNCQHVRTTCTGLGFNNDLHLMCNHRQQSPWGTEAEGRASSEFRACKHAMGVSLQNFCCQMLLYPSLNHALLPNQCNNQQFFSAKSPQKSERYLGKWNVCSVFVVPVSSTSAESSFSCLHLWKTHLRSTLSQSW